jgi:hypothetical protein
VAWEGWAQNGETSLASSPLPRKVPVAQVSRIVDGFVFEANPVALFSGLASYYAENNAAAIELDLFCCELHAA